MSLTQHDFFLRTDRNYREKVVAERVLAMGDLLVIIAHQAGIQFDPITGKLSGLSKEDQAVISAAYAGNVDVKVGESSPIHQQATAGKVASEDTYLESGSERVEGVPDWQDGHETNPDEDPEVPGVLLTMEELHGAGIAQLRVWAQQLDIPEEGSKSELRDRIAVAIQPKE